jgi:hypothetical protein
LRRRIPEHPVRLPPTGDAAGRDVADVIGGGFACFDDGWHPTMI